MRMRLDRGGTGVYRLSEGFEASAMLGLTGIAFGIIPVLFSMVMN